MLHIFKFLCLSVLFIVLACFAVVIWFLSWILIPFVVSFFLLWIAYAIYEEDRLERKSLNDKM